MLLLCYVHIILEVRGAGTAFLASINGTTNTVYYVICYTDYDSVKENNF